MSSLQNLLAMVEKENQLGKALWDNCTLQLSASV